MQTRRIRYRGLQIALGPEGGWFILYGPGTDEDGPHVNITAAKRRVDELVNPTERKDTP